MVSFFLVSGFSEVVVVDLCGHVLTLSFSHPQNTPAGCSRACSSRAPCL
jgi:hypothetical protein